MKSFASDNYSGVHPEVLEAIGAANRGHAPSYGGDPWTERLTEVMHGLFGEHTQTYPVFNGTGANVIALQSVLPRWGAVICAKSAHINGDEGAAPERMGNLKLLAVDTEDGKLTPALVDHEAWGWGNEHRAQPLVVSISQTTEYGTCYTPEEIRALADHAHERGMTLHVDGSRLSNAAAYLGCSLRDITTDAGVDILSLGGTKNGLLGAEAVVVLNPEAVQGLPFIRKFSMQLGSKMRFLSAQLLALYEGDLWLRSAQHANAMTQRLYTGLRSVQASDPTVRVLFEPQSNAVFARIAPESAERARAVYRFYNWPGGENEFRLMCSFDTQEAEVDHLVSLIAGR